MEPSIATSIGQIQLDKPVMLASGILGILGICTKLKYQSNPIHIIATITCDNLKNQLQKYLSISNPPLLKNNPKNKIINTYKKELHCIFCREEGIRTLDTKD